MKVGLAGCFGLFLGATVGGIVGVGLGFAWTVFFHTTSFEGYSGMLVFYSFTPIGIIARRAARRRRTWHRRGARRRGYATGLCTQRRVN
jgi:hypothetical protein